MIRGVGPKLVILGFLAWGTTAGFAQPGGEPSVILPEAGLLPEAAAGEGKPGAKEKKVDKTSGSSTGVDPGREEAGAARESGRPEAERAEKLEGQPPLPDALTPENEALLPPVPGPHPATHAAFPQEQEAGAEFAEPAEPGPIRLWFRNEFLLGMTKRAEPPPLLSSGVNDGSSTVVVGQGGRVIYGGTGIDFHERPGGRFTVGLALREADSLYAEASYLFLASRSVGPQLNTPTFNYGPNAVGRPFFDVPNNRPDASIVGFPDLAVGTVEIKQSNFFAGFEANLGWRVCEFRRGHLDFLVGFRHWNLEESLRIDEVVTGGAKAGAFAGRTARIRDFFATDNDFYGGQVGMKAVHFRRKRLQLESFAKVAFGGSNQTVRIQGVTVLDNPVAVLPGGLLALPTNIGTDTHGNIAVIPEVGVNVGVRLAERLLVNFGYTFIYWNGVSRPGQQIDPGLDPRLIPTSTVYGQPGALQRPFFLPQDNDFWVHGFSFGMELKY